MGANQNGREHSVRPQVGVESRDALAREIHRSGTVRGHAETRRPGTPKLLIARLSEHRPFAGVCSRGL